MPTAIVVGAGWAGLSCAAELADKGFKVTLLEQSKRLGGRASSFLDEKTNEVVDNGQHLFMGCYVHTLNFLKKICSLDKLQFQKNLRVDFVDRKGRLSSLDCRALPSPLHLLSGLWNLKTLSLKDKASMFKVWMEIRRLNGSGKLDNLTVDEWLGSLGQSERSRRNFWDLITIAALNEQSSIAEAGSLAVVLKEAFFSSAEKSQLGISSVGLSEICGEPTRRYLASRGGDIQLDTLVSRINAVGECVRGLVLRDGRTLTADLYVSALPFFVLKNILGEHMNLPFFSRIRNLESSPIFSISLWFDRPITDCQFAALLETRVQWLFNKEKIFSGAAKGYISLVISGAREYLSMTNEELLKICLGELGECFPESKNAKLRHWLVQREKNATLSPKVGYDQFRLPQKTPLKNFLVCGDWTATGLPATIESAVLSGVRAASYT